MDSQLTNLLKDMDKTLTPSGKCWMCGLEIVPNGIVCCRQSCLLLWSLQRNDAAFWHVRPCAWPESDVLPLSTDWSKVPIQHGRQQPVPQYVENMLKRLVCGNDPLDDVMRELRAHAGA